MIKASFFIHGDHSAGQPAGELQCLVSSFSLLYCHLLDRCSQAGAISIIITAAAGGCIITIIMAIAAIITITTAIIGNNDKDGKEKTAIRRNKQ